MSPANQPYIDPSEIALEGSAAQRFKSRSDAFWTGIRDAAGAPAMVLFAGMVGFGAMGKTNGMDAWFTGATSFLMFALPGQVVLLEMAITGSSVLAIALAVTLTSTRFITMTVTLFPQFHEKDRNHSLYASVHLSLELFHGPWFTLLADFSTWHYFGLLLGGHGAASNYAGSRFY
ncbi:MAG: hypothetical protein RJA46_81 [Pseudomonadota bacterium]